MPTSQEAPSFVLVEPDEDDRLFMREAVRQTGSPYSIVELTSGPDLIAYLQQELREKGDKKVLWLLVMDFNMPAMNGLEVLRTMQQHPLWRQVPVIVLSAFEDPDIKAQVLEAGAASYLVKPTSIEQLADQIIRAFGPWIANPISLQ